MLGSKSKMSSGRCATKQPIHAPAAAPRTGPGRPSHRRALGWAVMLGVAALALAGYFFSPRSRRHPAGGSPADCRRRRAGGSSACRQCRPMAAGSCLPPLPMRAAPHGSSCGRSPPLCPPSFRAPRAQVPLLVGGRPYHRFLRGRQAETRGHRRRQPRHCLRRVLGPRRAVARRRHDCVRADANSPLVRVNAAGGPPTPWTALANDEPGHRFPQRLPGRQLLYFSVNRAPEKSGTRLISIDDPHQAIAYVESQGAAGYVNGFLLIVPGSLDGQVLAQRMSLPGGQLTEEPFEIGQTRISETLGRHVMASSPSGVIAMLGPSTPSDSSHRSAVTGAR